MKQKLLQSILGLAIIVLISFIIADKEQPTKKALATYAQEVLGICADASYRPTCYEEEVPKLMREVSMEEAFEITQLVQDQDKSYTYCHVLGHKLSAQETAKDPSRWKEVIARSPSGLCSNGSIHGAFQERFRTEVLSDSQIEELKPELADICESKPTWKPTGLEQGTCYHALGHLLMYVSGADIYKSLKVCEPISIKDNGLRDYSQLCFDGAFMQIFQPLEPEDFALVEGKQPKKENLATFCNQFTDSKKGPCWNEGWPLYRDQIMNPRGLVQYCSNSILTDPGDENRCYLALFYVVTAQMAFDQNKLTKFCTELSANRIGQCFANAVSRMIETDYRNSQPAIDFCSSLEDSDVKNECFQELVKYSTYNFHPKSPEYFNLCNNMPQPWKNQCLAK